MSEDYELVATQKIGEIMTNLERLEIAVREAEKLWKLYQIRLQIQRDKLQFNRKEVSYDARRSYRNIGEGND